MEKNTKKRKFKLEPHIIYSLRKLRNVSLEEFKTIISKILNDLLTESELTLVNKANDLIVKSYCDNYKYSPNDFALLKESSRIFINKIPLYIRKNIEIFEKSHNIKTMWGEENFQNTRSQNFKLDSYE